MSLTLYRRRPDDVADLLSDAGLTLRARLLRKPDDDGFETTPHAFLIARKPLASHRDA